MGAVIQARGLRKLYRQGIGASEPVDVLEDVSFEVARGRMFTVLGPNGAGKTTLIRILAGLVVPSGGEASVAGVSLGDQGGLARKIGLFTPGAPPLFGFLTGRESLRVFAALQGLLGPRAEERIEELIRSFGLGAHADRKWRHYSTGIQRRFLLVRALLHDPEVLLLDEPAAHLDPAATRQFYGLLRERLLAGLGKTVLLTTHQLEQAQEFSDDIGILHRGRMAWQGAAQPFRSGQANLLERYLAALGTEA